MSGYAAQLVAEVKATGIEETKSQLDSVSKKVDESKSHFEGLKNALSTAAGFAIFGGVMAGVGFLKDQISDVVKVTEQYQQTQTQTNQVLKSTNDVSGMTAESLENLAQAYGKTTMFSADTVQQGENLLLTFTNIGHQVFPQATQAILDVSQAMGQDLKSSAIQVGKALGDPLTGMTALQRIGVTFSQSEKDQIKTMMAHNDIIGAQKIILHELSTEFGGSATAAGKTFAGQMAILGNQFDEIKIKIGQSLLPILSDLMNKYVVPLASAFQNWMLHGGGLQDFQTWLKNADNILQSQIIPDFRILLNQALIPLAQATYDLFIKSGFLSNAFNILQGIFRTVVPLFGDFVGWLNKGGTGVDILKAAMIPLGIAVAAVKIGNIVSDMTSFIGKVPDMVAKMFLVQQGAEGIAGSEGLEAIGPAAKGAAAGVEAASTGMKLSLAGVLSAVGAVAAAEISLAMWLRNNNIVPAAPVQGNNQPSWVTHNWRNATPSNNPNLQNTNSDVLGAHASGILDNPIGHWAMVGERGPEMMYVPQGASILPNGMTPSGVGGTQQPIILVMDGRQVGYGLMPHIVNNIRNTVGVRI